MERDNIPIKPTNKDDPEIVSRMRQAVYLKYKESFKANLTEKKLEQRDELVAALSEAETEKDILNIAKKYNIILDQRELEAGRKDVEKEISNNLAK